MNNDRELLQQALDALDVATTPLARDRQEVLQAQAALRARLAQIEPEPVAVWELQEDGWDTIADPDWMESLPVGTKLYTAPPQREELRRLHEVNAELVEALKEMVEWYAARDANDQIRPALNQNPEIHEAMQVLAKATGEQQ